MTKLSQIEPTFEEKEAINKLLSRAESGDQSVLPQLREFLDSRPDFWAQIGDLSFVLLHTLIEKSTPKSLLQRESLKLKVQSMEKELAGQSPSEIERLLARRVVIGWLLVHAAELDAANLAASGVVEGSHIQRRADSANRRYMQALKTLAAVRRLLPRQERLTTFSDAGELSGEAGTPALAVQTIGVGHCATV